MYSYITSELPSTVFEEFRQIDPERVSIFGHSMGGHGALTLFLKNPGKYATELVKKWSGPPLDVLIDVGTADQFYNQQQLLPENFAEAAKGKGEVKIRMQDGYDHSYFTMATFADDHVEHAAKYLFS